ncbi:MAG: MBL fold metallo-hydrolase, partial [Syntrophomonadaceae bacterium]|nr:MBL fold metallo-hydrolase [Syntrophomonadaceae bacterium]
PVSMNYKLREASEYITDRQVLDFGRTKVEVLHLPGHTPGHCGFLFSDLGIVLSSDVSFHSFGPWYGNVESDVSEFLNSIERLMLMKPERLITSHTSGLISSNIQARLRSFRDVIYARDKKIINAMYKGKHSLWDIVDENIIYRSFHQPQWRYFEWFMIRSHLKRLVKIGRVFVDDNEQYYLNEGIRPSNIILG